MVAIAHPSLRIEVVHHGIVVVLMVVVDSGTRWVGSSLIICRLANVHTVISLVVMIPIESIVLICIYLI